MSDLRHALLVAIGTLGVAGTGCRSDEPLGTPNDILAAAQAAGGQPCRGSFSCRLAFTVQPGTTPAGAAITPQVEVTVQDPLGNLVTAFSGNVRMAIGTNPSGGRLRGTRSVGAINGVARFADLSIDRPGSGYTLAATSGPLTSAQSAPFTITGPATQLVFTVQPTNTSAGAVIAPAIQVTARDAVGNVATDFTGNVTVAITPGTGAPGATLSGTLTATATQGVAAFPDLSINRAGVAYTLTATALGLTAATSAAFDITSGAASRLAFTVQPSTTVAGFVITPAVHVTAQDPFGNTDPTFTGQVTVLIGDNPAAGLLSGTNVKTATAGVATFNDLSIDKAGSGYTLVATALGLTSATSAAFDILAGPATQLVFTVQPSNTVAGDAITPAVQVTAQDAFGNTDVTFPGTVAMGIGTNPGGGALSGTTVQPVSQGVAHFADLSIDNTGNGYTLVASSGALLIGSGGRGMAARAAALPSETSTAFAISAGPAVRLVFIVQPSNTAVGASISPAVQVAAVDVLGNIDLTFLGLITVSIGTNPSGGALSGTTTAAAVAGISTFANLSIDPAGTGYELNANAAGLTGATSVLFNIL